MKAILGRKLGMTQLFLDNGTVVPVTVVEAGPCVVTQKKTTQTDGYNAIQLGFEDIREKLVSKPLQGHFKKAGVSFKRSLREYHVDNTDDYTLGQEIKVDVFEKGDIVDIQGTSKGKGFQGTIKRWNFSMGDATHGNSLSHRSPGSIGQRQTPGRVFPGKKMSGHMGAETQTTQRLRVVKVDAERGLIAIKGAVPGAPGGDVIVRPSSKA